MHDDTTTIGATRKLLTDAIEKLAQQLEARNSESLKAWLRAMKYFRKHSWANTLLILLQRPDATQVAGLRAWSKLQRQVRRGERGIAIYAPIIHTFQVKQNDSDSTEERQLLTGYKIVYVFDIKQTDGQPFPQFAKVSGDPGDAVDKLRVWAAKEDISVAYTYEILPAMGMSYAKRVEIVPHQGDAKEFAVLCHELAHVSMHFDDSVERLPKHVTELEAEAVSFALCSAIGLDTNTAACDYIKLYGGNRDLLMASLRRIHDTANRLLEVVL
jgi:antirestriction protein ArdC